MVTWFLLPAISHLIYVLVTAPFSLTPHIVHLLQSVLVQLVKALHRKLHSLQLVSTFCKLPRLQSPKLQVPIFWLPRLLLPRLQVPIFWLPRLLLPTVTKATDTKATITTHLIILSQRSSLALVLGVTKATVTKATVTKATPIPVIFPQHSSPLLCDTSWAAAVTNILSGRYFKPNKSHCNQRGIVCLASPHSHSLNGVRLRGCIHM